MASLTYVTGDVTKPIRDEDRWILIPHITNNIGRWGAGVSGAIGRAFPKAESDYRNRGHYALGQTDFVIYPEHKIGIANMIAQHGIKPSRNTGTWMEAEDGPAIIRPPIRYAALATCMRTVRQYCYSDGKPWCDIHAARFGAGLAGGNWDIIESLILELWIDLDLNVTIYTLE